ncbi:MAG: pantetheine-phosphate adenylyltransferase [Candidatus Sumerlaeia bacterium]|nr:pantetheine-phosphate adenylyltransferase [Candidatus Sumerlaeia bacterium]
MPPKIKIAIYPGTFDPITNGHADLIHRSSHMFDRVIVAVTENPAKKVTFPIEDRLAMIRETIADWPTVSVEAFDGLTVEFARSVGARYIVRGLRAVGDFDYELQMGMMNRQLAPEVETVFLVPAAEYIFVSSTLVKDVIRLGGSVSNFVPPPVEKRLLERLAPPMK